ncbi:hypothetical protein, partial [Rhodococcus sp. NPDC058514]
AALFKRMMRIAREHGTPCYGEAKSADVAEMCSILGWSVDDHIRLPGGHSVVPVRWHPSRSDNAGPAQRDIS